MKKVSTRLLEQETQTPSPAPDLIPAESSTENLHWDWYSKRGHFIDSLQVFTSSSTSIFACSINDCMVICSSCKALSWASIDASSVVIDRFRVSKSPWDNAPDTYFSMSLRFKVSCSVRLLVSCLFSASALSLRFFQRVLTSSGSWASSSAEGCIMASTCTKCVSSVSFLMLTAPQPLVQQR